MPSSITAIDTLALASPAPFVIMASLNKMRPCSPIEPQAESISTKGTLNSLSDTVFHQLCLMDSTLLSKTAARHSAPGRVLILKVYSVPGRVLSSNDENERGRSRVCLLRRNVLSKLVCPESLK